MSLRAIIHASEVLTGVGIRKKEGRRVSDEDLGRISDGAVVYRVKKIGKKMIPTTLEWVGPTQELPTKWKRIPTQNLRRQRAIIPGLIDCHNHLIFAGDRSEEFAARCAGATYEEIAKKGGGILTTVQATRQATEAQLEKLAIPRMKELYQKGVRTLEVKSGYGLSTESELKILRVVQRLKRRFPEMTLVPTFLGAHAFPKDLPKEDYFNLLMNEMLPRVVREGLAQSCDVFVDEGYFTLEQARSLLSRAKSLGLAVRIHADELGNTESTSLAVELKALSADHLLRISESGIQRLARSQTVGVLLPGTAFYLKAPHAPARRLLDVGAKIALATDFNPGTCMCLNLPTVMSIAALYLGMSRSEIFSAVTYNAACALGLQDSKGTLEPGKDADFWVMPFARFEEAYYRFAW